MYYENTLIVRDHNDKTLRSVRNILSLRVRYEGSDNESTYTASTPVKLNGEGT